MTHIKHTQQYALLGVALLLLVSPSQTWARDRSRSWGLGLDLGLAIPVAPEFAQNFADPGLLAGAHVRYHFDSFWGLALNYDRLEYGKSPLLSSDLNAGAFVRWSKESDLTPWTYLGVGAHRVSDYSTTPDYWKFGIKAELGVELDASDSVSLGAKLAYFSTRRKDHSLQTWAPVIAATWYFCGPKSDSPKTEPVVAPSAPSPTQEAVFAQAITSKEGVKIQIEFDSGSAAVKPSHSSEVKKIADYLQSESDAKIVIEGHTDSSGVAAKNQILSQARADALKNALIREYSIAGDRIESVGYGASQPLTSNATAQGRAKNRRVMARIKEE